MPGQSEQDRTKKTNSPIVAERLTICLVVTILLLSVYNLTTTRSFGIYPSGQCAYEDVDLPTGAGKASCPAVMPKQYNSHTVSPLYKL